MQETRVLGVAGPSRGIPNADQLCRALTFLPPGCLVSLAFLGSEGQGSLTPLSCRAEGGLKRGDGLFLLVLPGGGQISHPQNPSHTLWSPQVSFRMKIAVHHILRTSGST